MENLEKKVGGVPEGQFFVYPDVVEEIGDPGRFREELLEAAQEPDASFEEMFPVLEENPQKKG